MLHGVIEDFYGAVQWTIPDFSLDNKLWQWDIKSPQFSSVGSTWHLRLYLEPWCDNDGWLTPQLISVDSPPEMVTYSFGLKANDDTIRAVCTANGVEAGPRKPWALYYLRSHRSELFPSDTLTITCRIEREVPEQITKNPQNRSREQADLQNRSPEEITRNPQEVNFPTTTIIELEDLSSDLQGLLSSEKTCDFTVNVQGKEFRVHRSLLAARSSVFRAMLEHDTAEAKRGVLDVPDCHSESFQEFINFLYTGKIEELTFELAYHLYSIAEKYDVQRLKSHCASYLKQNLSADNVCKIVLLADLFCDEQLQSSAQDFFNKNSMQIFLTSEWEAMMRNHSRIFNKVLKEMASASSKNS